MATELILFIISSVLILVLIGLLVARARAERRAHAVIHNLDMEKFQDFLRTSAGQTEIREVAARVSELLQEAFGCDRILFVRKRRQFLDVSYRYGLGKTKRTRLRMLYDPKLVEYLGKAPTPLPTSELQELIPKSNFDALMELRLEVAFPIYWRDHLYGLYFVHTEQDTRSRTFQLMVRALSQSLAAAYHVRWQESRTERMEVSSKTRQETVSADGDRQLLTLVRSRDSEMIVGQVFRQMTDRLAIKRAGLLCEGSGGDAGSRWHGQGLKQPQVLPQGDGFRKLCALVKSGRAIPLTSIKMPPGEDTGWVSEMQTQGLEYALSVPLSDKRSGVLFWSDGRKPQDVVELIQPLAEAARALVANAELFEELEALTFTDNLTGLYNRRYFSSRLEEEIDRARRYERKMALIVFDFDDLKVVNDSYGHQAGDDVLRQMGEVLRTSLRSIDVVARYGGDEFCLIMPEADATTCRRFMRRLQGKIRTTPFRVEQLNKTLECTISQGAAIFPESADSAEQLVYVADMALLKAKDSGRDCYVLGEVPAR